MKPTHRHPFRLAALVAAGLLPGHLHADTIVANKADARFQTGVNGVMIGGASAATSGSIYIGREYYSEGLLHMVVPFQLPDLGEGTFSDVSVSFYVPGNSNYQEDDDGNPLPSTPTMPADAISLNLHLIDGVSRASSAPITSDVYDLAAATQPGNHLTRGFEVMTPFVTPSDDPGWITTPADGAEETLLTNKLNQAYANGEKSGGFIFFRLSPTVLNPDSLTAYNQPKGLSVSTANSGSAPYLTYTFTPVNPNAPAISQFVADRTTIGTGGGATLSWTTANATTLSLSNSRNATVVDVTGLTSTVVTPTATTTYTLTAENALGSRTRSVTIAVNAAITLRGTSTANAAQSATSITLNKPNGVSSGDVLIAAISRNASTTGNMSTPTGWTLIDQRLLRDPGNNNKSWGAVFYRVAGATEASSYSFTLNATTSASTSNGASGVLLAYSGVDVTNGLNKDGSTGGPFDIVPGTINVNGTSTTASAVASSITTATANSGIVMLGMVGGSSFTWSGWNTLSPGSLTEVAEIVRGGSSAAAAWAVKSTAGPTGNGTATTSGNAQIPGAILLALKEGTAPPAVTSFTASASSVDPGTPVTLNWNVIDASTITINNGIGTVSSSGSVVVNPTTTTTYTITAQNSGGKQATAGVTVTVLGPGPYRYYRFVAEALRGSFSNPVQISEFQLLLNGVRKPAVTVTNPGGQNTVTATEGANKANDNDLNTKWHDNNKAPLVYDMGTNSTNWNVNAYRIATAGDAPERDPVTWRVEGSHDAATWIELNRQTDFPITESRNTYVAPNFSITDFNLPYVTFGANRTSVTLGESANLYWYVQNATTVSIDNGIGTVAGSGQITVTPSNATDYTITATNSSGQSATKTVRISVGTNPFLLPLANASFESDANSDPTGAFFNGQRVALNGWSIIATDNTSTPLGSQVALGSQDLTPAAGSQALGLMSGVAITQMTNVRWSSLGPGDQLRLTLAAGDRSTPAAANPRWADESFFGISDGRISKVNGSTPAATGWLNNVVAKSSAVATPPGGFKAGTMGDVTLSYEVTAADYDRNGFVGIFIASLGNRDVSGNGTDIPASQSFWDNVRLEVVTPPGPTINQFSSDTTLTNGGAATLTWDVQNADSISISSGIGSVNPIGSLEVTPSGTTTYTLSATNSAGTKTRSITIRVQGPAIYRYFRFSPTAIRNPSDGMVQISEFELLFGTNVITGATATNPGGSNAADDWEGASKAVDGSFGTKWLDQNIKPLILDYGKTIAATGYRFVTGNDADGRDPVSWILEGSHDKTTWYIVDQKDNATITTNRQTRIATIGTFSNSVYPSSPGAPTVNSFSASPASINEGDTVTLSWDVTNSTSVYLVGVGDVAATGSLNLQPAISTNYQLIVSNASGTAVAATVVQVARLPRGTLFASYDDAEFLTYTDDGSLVSEFPSGEFFTILDVGRFRFDDVLRHLVIPFQLPNLGAGAFTLGELSLRVYGSELGTSGRTNIQLFGINEARDSSYTLGTDVVNGADNHLNNGTLLKSGMLNATTPLDSTVGSGEVGGSAAAIGYWLNQLYANGANAGKWVFLRLSPDALSIPEGYGFGVSTGDDSDAPTLTYVFDPNGSAGMPVIAGFNSSVSIIETGAATNLNWSVLGADSVSISGGVGNVAGSGSVSVSPSETTTYTLTALNANGQRTATTTVTVVAPGAYRYYRFVPLAIRSSNTLKLSELQFLSDGVGLSPVEVTSPYEGSDFRWTYGSPANLSDGLFTWPSLWEDELPQPVIFEFNSYVSATSYRFGTWESTSNDPVSWRIEGSRDKINWEVLDTRTNVGEKITTERNTLTRQFYLIPGVPDINSFAATPQIIFPGELSTLSWNVSEVPTVTLNNGIGTQPSVGSIQVSPTTTTTYTLGASGEGVTDILSRTVYVANTGLIGSVFDTIEGASHLSPISGLLTRTPDGQFVQEGILTYENGSFLPNLPGLTTEDSFVVLWRGWFDVTKDGPGTYTFGVGSDDLAVVYIDLNDDGDFADAGEQVAYDSTNGSASSYILGTVNLTAPSYRIAIAFSEGGGEAIMRSGFKKGSGYTFNQLSPIDGSTGHFMPAKPLNLPLVSFTASPQALVLGQSSTISWNVSNANSIAISGYGTGLPSSGSFTINPTANTSYTLSATNADGTRTVPLTVVVKYGSLDGRSYDTLDNNSLLSPISGLINSTPTATFVQLDPIVYADNQMYGKIPGITSKDNFSVLWTGWFNVAVDGAGAYTFGNVSDDTGVIYLDLNKDGDFNDTGERIVDGNQTSSVVLTDPAYRIAIGYRQGAGNYYIDARFKKGSGLAYAALDPINNGTAHFQRTEPVGSAPFITFDVSPANIAAGGSSTLTWSVSGSTSVSIDNGIGSVAASGSTTVSPSATTTYTLTATGPGGTSDATAQVTIVPAPTLSVTANPATIKEGEEVEVSWTSTNSTNVSIAGLGNWGGSSGRTFERPLTTTTYTLTAYGIGGSTTKSVTVTVLPKPVVTFTASTTEVLTGGSVTLSWNVTGADSVSIDLGIGNVAATGSITVSPTASSNYTLTAVNTNGTSAKSLLIEVVSSLPLRYTFDDLTLQGWRNLLKNGSPGNGWSATTGHGDTDYFPNTTEEPRSPGAARSTFHDASHPTQILRSPEFTLNSYGDLTARVAGGNGGSLSVPVAVSSIPTNSIANTYVTGNEDDGGEIQVNGFMGIALRSVNSGQYVLAASKINTGNQYESLTIPAAALAGLNQSHRYTLDFIDSVHGGWGWASLDNVVIPGNPVQQPITITLTASPAGIAAGGSTTLSWSATNATTVDISGVGTGLPATGTATVSPATTTTYTLTASNDAGPASESVTVNVVENALMAYTYDTRPGGLGGYPLIPISNLIDAEASGSFAQVGDLEYDESGARPSLTTLPGITDPDAFAVLWLGWFDVTLDGPGAYTFGLESDDGSILYLDLNNDGDFADAGERILDAEFGEGSTATVNLPMNYVRFALGYEENTGGQFIRARFSKGSGVSWNSLNPINGSTGHFLGNAPGPVTPAIVLSASPSIISQDESSVLSWSITNATSATIDDGSGPIAIDAVSGTLTVSPSTTTTYTLVAEGAGGSSSDQVTLTVNPPAGPGPYRYYRFVPTALRNPDDNSVTLGEFQMLLNGVRVTGATAFGTDAVGGIDDPADGEEPFYSNDNDPETKWLDFNKTNARLVLDFGAPQDVTGYRIGFSDDNGGRAPVSWRIEGSPDAVSWKVLDVQVAYPVPTEIGYLADFETSPFSGAAISVSGHPGGLSTVYGVASSASAFTVSASGLTSGVTITAPGGFEVSSSAAGSFGSSIVIGGSGSLSPVQAYVRIAADANAGSPTGNLTLSSPGVVSRTLAVASNTVTPKALSVTAAAKSKTYGNADPAFTYSADGLVGSDGFNGALLRDAGESVGIYAINRGTLSAGSNYTLSFTGADLTITPKALAGSDITLIRDGNSYTASASGVGGFTYSYVGRNGTSYGPSADAPSADGDYTVTATVNDSNYTGSKSEDFTVESVEPPQDHPAFKVTSMTMVGTVCTMTWESQPGASYTLQATDNPADPQSWTTLMTGVASQGSTTSMSLDIADTTHVGATKLFMRIKAE